MLGPKVKPGRVAKPKSNMQKGPYASMNKKGLPKGKPDHPIDAPKGAPNHSIIGKDVPGTAGDP